MQPKLSAADSSRGLTDAVENLQAMGYRKGLRRVMAWIRGPHWIPNEATLQGYKTMVRGSLHLSRASKPMPVTECRGEISVDWIVLSTLSQ